MIRGIGSSKAGMAVEQVRADVIAQNVSNINTDGFKRSVAVSKEFAGLLLHRWDSAEDGSTILGRLGNGASLDQIVADATQGAIQETGNPLDVALTTPGEFSIMRPEGLGFTRNGAFRRDAEGVLVTAEGHPVLVDGAPFGRGVGEIQIQADGTVLADGQSAGRLSVRSEAPFSLKTGWLEKSNVDLAREMTDLMMAIRIYQANQRALQMQDETLGKAVSELGSL